MICAKQATFFNVAEKRATLYLVIAGIWLLILAGSAPSFWRTFSGLDSLLAKGLFVPFAGCLALFWFYGVYHSVLLVFSYMGRPDLGARAQALAKDKPFSPKVAIIYTTYNDFNSQAALTCLNQDYPNYQVFLLDVSTNPDMRKRVDAFQEEFAPATTLVRLQPRQGFKARSLNDTLKTAVGDDYEFFAVCDADNYWPSDFLSRTIPYFLLDERIAFVQANPTNSGRSEGKFTKDFGVAVDASWALHQRARDRYGLLMCMGHSVVVRREAWEKAGGYPEIVQEDTAFTMSLRRHGYYGLFAPEVLCGEEFPEDFGRCRRRQFRLVQADTEILSTQMPKYLKDKNISFIEKIDLLARTIRLPSQALALPFLLLAFPVIPLVGEGALSATSIDRAFGSMLSPGLVAVTLLTAAAPLYPFFVYLRRKPLKLVPLLFRSITLHYSPLALAITSFVVYILRGRAMFLVTGTQDGAAIRSQPVGVVRGFLQRLSPDSRLVIALDVVLALILGYVGIITGGLVLIGIALVLLMSPVMRRYGWHNRAISVAVYLPLALVIAGLVTSLSGGIGAQSQYLALAVLAVLLF
jgi:cellulose synthase/poly-beta-1,6-N-acetylglucosamine synthase-like glycosyltransferase